MNQPDTDNHWWLCNNKALWAALIVWTGLGVAGAYLPLVADETYYLSWSKHLALGYFDHPPMIAYLIAAFGQMPRLTAWVTCGLSVGILTLSARRLDIRHWYTVPLLFFCTPLGVAASIIATPDTPLLLACSLIIYGLVSDRSIWLFVGLSIGLWSKPTGLFLFPALWLLYRKKHALLITTGVLICYAPHALWSLDHGGLPWSFQTQREFSINLQSPMQLLELLGTQILLVGPLLTTHAWHLLREWRSPTNRLYVFLALPTLFCAILFSLGMRIEGNWPMLMWPPILLFALKRIEGQTRPELPHLQRCFMVTTVLLALMIATLHQHIPPQFGPDRDGHRLHHCLRQAFPTKRIVTTRYQETAMLRYAGGSPTHVRPPGSRGSQFDLWTENARIQPTCNDIVLGTPTLCQSTEAAEFRCGVRTFECQCPDLP